MYTPFATLDNGESRDLHNLCLYTARIRIYILSLSFSYKSIAILIRDV